MNRQVRQRLAAFQRAQRRSARYHVSVSTPHERAIREHKKRGFTEGLNRIAGLLDQRNRLDR